MSKYKAILFDLDGTIIDSSEGITKSTQYALKSFGIKEDDLDKLRVFIGPPLSDSFMKYYNFNEKDAQAAVTKYRERYKPIGVFECKLYPHVKECLKALKDKGYVTGIASSKPEEMCKIILNHLGISELFDEVVGATEDGRIGTKKQVLDELFRRWKDYDRSEVILVGDTIFDIEGANQAEIDSCGVSFGFGDINQMKNAGALFIIDDMLDLINKID